MVNPRPLSLLRAAALVAVVAATTVAAQQPLRSTDSVPDTARTIKLDPRGVIFIQRGCNACHAIAALGVRAKSDVGPDLTFAYADVVIRYDRNLEAFLGSPTGVMEMVSGGHPVLSTVDRDSVVTILRALYLEHRAEMDENIPSFPPGNPRGDRRRPVW
jgi:mono/diheme cytochrome c family protein